MNFPSILFSKFSGLTVVFRVVTVSVSVDLERGISNISSANIVVLLDLYFRAMAMAVKTQ